MLFDDIRVNGVPAARRPIGAATALLLVAALCVAGGCRRDGSGSDQQSRASANRAKKDTLRRTEPADPFDLGAGRKPTPDTMFALSKILAARDRRTESMEMLRHIITQYPSYLPAYNALAETHIQIGQSEEAIAVLTAGLKRAPNDAVLLNNMGMAHFIREEYAEALPNFEKAADLRPEVPLYRANKAAALGMLGRTREARLEYRQILPAKDADENVAILDRARRRPGPKPVAAEPVEPQAEPRAEPQAAEQPLAPVVGQP